VSESLPHLVLRARLARASQLYPPDHPVILRLAREQREATDVYRAAQLLAALSGKGRAQVETIAAAYHRPGEPG
jgi:hypothetical protein